MIWAALGASMFAYCSRAPNLHRTPHLLAIHGVQMQNLQCDFVNRRLYLARQTPHAYAFANLRADCVAAKSCAGTNRHFFSNAVQFMITVGGAAFVSPINVPIKNR